MRALVPRQLVSCGPNLWVVDKGLPVAAVLAEHQVPALTGVGDARTRLIGQWPVRQLEWTFSHPSRPGLRLRRQLDLYDRLGRPAPPEYSDIHPMEDLCTDARPPA